MTLQTIDSWLCAKSSSCIMSFLYLGCHMHTGPSSVKGNFENWNGMLKLIQKVVEVVNWSPECNKTWSNNSSNYRQLAEV